MLTLFKPATAIRRLRVYGVRVRQGLGPLVCALLLLAVLGGSNAWASGAGTISGAPTLPFGTQVAGGAQISDVCCDSWYQQENTPGVEYYRVPLNFGDTITINYSAATTQADVNLCMLTPDVTDNTLPNSVCATTGATDVSTGNVNNQLQFTATVPGTWTLVVGAYHCCGEVTWGYQLVGTVQRSALANAWAPGAATISGAPILPLGTQVAGGAEISDVCCDSWYQHENTPGVEYYRIPLNFGDIFTSVYSAVTPQADVYLCMLSPDVTDYTLPSAQCATTSATDVSSGNVNGQLQFTATVPGTWTLVVGAIQCCSEVAWGFQLQGGVQPPPAPPCLVPHFTLGASLAAVEQSIVANHCSVGHVDYAYSKMIGAGGVLSLRPAPGASLASGSAVAIRVSAGPPPINPHLRLVHVSASRRHGVALQGTTLPTVVGHVYIYASCGRAKTSRTIPLRSGRFSGHIRLPRLCLIRRASRIRVGAVLVGSAKFAKAPVNESVMIQR